MSAPSSEKIFGEYRKIEECKKIFGKQDRIESEKDMKILVADDEDIILKQLLDILKKVCPEAETVGFTRVDRLLEYAVDHVCDIAFLDIDMGSMSGIEIAKQLKIWYPHINIIFVTAYEEYMKTAFSMHVSGYLTKPVSEKDIVEELNNLRNPVEDPVQEGVVAKCFGTFDIFVNGRSMAFKRSKTKEMLAYLIDRRGNSVTSGELRAILWESTVWEKNTKKDRDMNHYFQVIKRDLVYTLKENGVEDIFISSWNKYAVDTTKIKCDYYDYMDDRPEGVQAYNGEYMAQYSWGEIKNVLLKDRKKNERSGN